MSSAPDLTSRILRYERAIVACGIAALVILCWWFLVAGAGMDHRHGMTMPAATPPFAALVTMWSLMMVAMMLPSAAPAVMLYARVRQARAADGTIGRTSIFLAGYLAVWLLFSIAAAGVQLLLTDGAMMVADKRAQAMLLGAAGLYQLSPVKSACLRQCRTPAQFFTRHWRPGSLGAFRLGVLHGAYCVGCCWVLMALLFVGGVMNFAWIAALTLIVGAEKLLPRGELLGRTAGVALVAAGAFRLLP